MDNYKVFLQEIDFNNNTAKSEYLVEQVKYDEFEVKEELFFNEDGSLASRTINDFENDIEIMEDHNNKLKFITVYIYDDNENLIKEIELEETKNKIVERNYEIDEDGHVISQDVIRDGVTESIKLYYNSEELVSTGHYINGGLIKIEVKEKDLYKHNYFRYDVNEQTHSKTIHLFDDYGRVNSISEYDGKDNLIKVTSQYFNDEGFTVYETNYDLITNILIEEISEYYDLEEFSSRIEKYYENMELVLEKRFRYEYTES